MTTATVNGRASARIRAAYHVEASRRGDNEAALSIAGWQSVDNHSPNSYGILVEEDLSQDGVAGYVPLVGDVGERL